MDQIRFFVEIDVPADQEINSDENYGKTVQAIQDSVTDLANKFGGTVRDLGIK